MILPGPTPASDHTHRQIDIRKYFTESLCPHPGSRSCFGSLFVVQLTIAGVKQVSYVRLKHGCNAWPTETYHAFALSALKNKWTMLVLGTVVAKSSFYA